jgi:hypothetical protein
MCIVHPCLGIVAHKNKKWKQWGAVGRVPSLNTPIKKLRGSGGGGRVRLARVSACFLWPDLQIRFLLRHKERQSGATCSE